jgi:hypothetical protein
MAADEKEKSFQRTKSDIKKYTKIIAENVFNGDYQQANARINQEYGVYSWTQNGKTLDEMKHRCEFIRRLMMGLLGDKYEGDFDDE